MEVNGSEGPPRGGPFSIPRFLFYERRHMKKLIWWTAAVLLAVLAFWSTMQAGVFAERWPAGGFPPKEDTASGQGKTDEDKETDETEEINKNDERNEEKDEEEEKKPEAKLSGSVGHCQKWEEHRKEANRFWQESGCSEQHRGPNVFWAGEKFLLRAEAGGETLPPCIRVLIEGTSYEMKLFPSAQEEGCRIYSGELFDGEMLFQWGNQAPETLEFIFSAEIDGAALTDRQQITVDNRQPYWLLHRKE